jgi:hypothetical protein
MSDRIRLAMLPRLTAMASPVYVSSAISLPHARTDSGRGTLVAFCQDGERLLCRTQTRLETLAAHDPVRVARGPIDAP